jgi:hypothetical protein
MQRMMRLYLIMPSVRGSRRGRSRGLGMRRKVLTVLLVPALAVCIAACEKYPTRSVNRNPIISSVVVFPTVLRLGDSTLVTVLATDPDGDSLVYDWEAYNGLAIKDNPNPDGFLYHTSSRSRVFYLQRRPANYDTAFIWCGVRDVKGGGDGRQILFLLRD